MKQDRRNNVVVNHFILKDSFTSRLALLCGTVIADKNTHYGTYDKEKVTCDRCLEMLKKKDKKC